jgi:hypothetical protein
MSLSTQWSSTPFGYVHKTLITNTSLLLSSKKVLVLLYQMISDTHKKNITVYKYSKSERVNGVPRLDSMLPSLASILYTTEADRIPLIMEILPRCMMIRFKVQNQPPEWMNSFIECTNRFKIDSRFLEETIEGQGHDNYTESDTRTDILFINLK